MKSNIFSKQFLLITSLFTFSILSAQENTSFSKIDSIQEAHPVVINTKMIERFNNISKEVEIIPWFEIYTTKTFEETKQYHSALNTMGNEAPSDSVYTFLTEQIPELKQEINENDMVYMNHASIDL